MDQDVVISVRGLTKSYMLYDKPIDRLKESLHPLRKVYHRDFKALDDINIEIKRGQTVGIIGKNGSGKSTLLKILTGVLSPTSGVVEVRGKIAALLELGAGFNPELTGYENIFLNGSLMGYTHEEMLSKVDAIVDFADIGDFINQPVKMYSSGMFARLAFSVAINVDPDILIVDEALSVGDIFFQAKCYSYFEKLQQKGRTVLFVTHSLDTIIRNCTTAFCLNKGSLVSMGQPSTVVDFYKKQEAKQVGVSHGSQEKSSIKLSSQYSLNLDMDSYGTLEAEIEDFAILDSAGVPQQSFYQGDLGEVYIRLKINSSIQSIIAAFALRTIDGVEVLGTNTLLERVDMSQLIRDGGGIVSFKFPFYLQSSDYLLSLGLTYLDSNGEVRVYHRLYNVLNVLVCQNIAGTGIFTPQVETVVSVGINE